MHGLLQNHIKLPKPHSRICESLKIFDIIKDYNYDMMNLNCSNNFSSVTCNCTSVLTFKICDVHSHSLSFFLINNNLIPLPTMFSFSSWSINNLPYNFPTAISRLTLLENPHSHMSYYHSCLANHANTTPIL